MSWEIIEPQSNLNPFQREHWRPRLHAGYFSIGDRRFYLYGKKKTRTLRQLTTSKFTLANWPWPYGRIEVTVNGKSYAYWARSGKDLLISHLDLDQPASFWGRSAYDVTPWERELFTALDFQPDAVVVVEYQTWLDGNADVTSVTEVLNFRNAEIEYWMPEVPGPGPVILTDDVPVEYQGNETTLEYTMVTDEVFLNRGTGALTGELVLQTRLDINAPENLVLNPLFGSFTGGPPGATLPNDWYLTSSSQGHGPSTYPYHGRHVAYSLGDGWVQQMVPATGVLPTTGEQMTLSAFARATTGTKTAVLGLNFAPTTGERFVDPLGNLLEPISDSSFLHYSKRQEVSASEWSRLEINMGATDLCHTGMDTAIPTGDMRFLVKLGGTGILWDGVVLEPSPRATAFGAICPESLTVEYEDNSEGVFVPDPAGTYPYDTASIDTNPVLDPSAQGFVAAVPSPWVDDFQLGYGNASTGEHWGDWAHYTGDGDDETLIRVTLETADATGARYIETPYYQNYGLTGVTAGLLAYIPGTTGLGLTGLVSPSDAVEYIGEILPAVQIALTGAAFTGVMLDVDGLAAPSSTNNPKYWIEALTGVKGHIDETYPGKLFGVHDGLDMFRDSVATRHDLAGVLDIIVVDGLTQDRDLEHVSPQDRRHKIAMAYQAVETAHEIANFDLEVMTLDFFLDTQDVDDVVEALHVGHSLNWLSTASCSGYAYTGASSRVFFPYGYPPAVDPASDGELLGRQHMPYARVDGPGKCFHVGIFGTGLPTRDPMPTYDIEEPLAHSIEIIPSGPSERQADSSVHASILGRPTTGEPEDAYHYTYQFSALVTDAIGNPMDGIPVIATAVSGTLLDGSDRVSVLRRYTDHAGYAVFDYQVKDAIPGDDLSMEVRRST